MTRRLTFKCVTTDASPEGSTVSGECWLGPIYEGDGFVTIMHDDDDNEEEVQLCVLGTAPSAALDRGQKGTLRLEGRGVNSLRPGDLLIGERDDT